MIAVTYLLLSDGREIVDANDKWIGTVGRTPHSLFRWSAWDTNGRLVTSRARSKTDATDALLDEVGAFG